MPQDDTPSASRAGRKRMPGIAWGPAYASMSSSFLTVIVFMAASPCAEHPEMGPRRLVETRPTGHGRARGLVSSRVSGGRIEARSYAAADDLRDVVAAYWMGRWDLRGQPPHTTEL